jgi:ribokinase
VKPSGQVVVVGTLNVDHLWRVPTLPRLGQTVLATSVERQFGGKGANQAVAAARQGAKVVLFGALGDDADGRLYREHLVRERVGADNVQAIAAVGTGTAHVYVDSLGENLIVVHRGANAHVSVSRLNALLRPIDVLLVQLECPLDAAVKALRLAAAAGARSILNASPVNAQFPWGAHSIDVVVANEHECHECFGLNPTELWDLSASALRPLLADRKVRHLVVTRGAEPTLHLAVDERHRVLTHRVEPRDTVGAGDTFAGTLAAELSAGRAWDAALRHANVAAALSTLAIGAQAAMPTRAEVEAALAEDK